MRASYALSSLTVREGLLVDLMTDAQETKATPKDYRIVWGHAARNFGCGDSGAGRFSLDSWDD